MLGEQPSKTLESPNRFERSKKSASGAVSTRAVETQRTATTLDTGVVTTATTTTTTATSSRDHDAGSCRPPPLQPGRVRPVPVQPSLRGSQGCTDGIMLTIIMTFAIMEKETIVTMLIFFAVASSA